VKPYFLKMTTSRSEFIQGFFEARVERFNANGFHFEWGMFVEKGRESCIVAVNQIR